MFKVMLFDDEPWILEDLKTIIDWGKMGYELIGEAKNGVEALALMKKSVPDLIITDIKMPGITGLELLETVNKKYKGILTVFISAYSDFSYAQQAVSLGAFGYLLKPVEKVTLCEELERAKNTLVRNRIERENTVKLELLRIVNDVTEKADIPFAKVMLDAGADIKNKTFIAGFIKSPKGMPLPVMEESVMRCSVYTVPIGNNRVVFLLAIPRELKHFSLLKGLVKYASSNSLTIGLSTSFHNVNDICRALNQASIMVDQNFITNKKYGCYLYSHKSIADFSSELKSVKTKAELFEFVKSLPKRIRRKKINLDGLYRIYCEIIKIIYTCSNESICPDEAKYLVETYRGMQEMIDFLEKAAAENMESSEKEPSRKVIKDVLAFIDENYNKKVLINDIANQFYLNPSYLSMLFKNETGKSFTTYLVQLRLEKAIELLRNEELTLYEISDMVGYDDYFHFSKLFKKHKNISPANYRKQMKTHKTTMKKHV